VDDTLHAFFETRERNGMMMIIIIIRTETINNSAFGLYYAKRRKRLIATLNCTRGVIHITTV